VNGAKVGDTVTYTLANGKDMTVEIRSATPYTG
jgi:transcription elongation GreA/GreB family factor